MTQRTATRRRLTIAVVLAVATPGCGDGLPSDLGSATPMSIRLNMHAVRLAVGEDTTVIATLHDRQGYVIPNPPPGFDVAWSSSLQSVATVESGLVRTVGHGQATITAVAASLPPASMEVQVRSTGPILIDSYQVIALGRLGGTQSNAWGVNDTGVAIGWSNASGGGAFRWSEPDGMTALPGITSTRGINNAGAIVGHSHHDSGWTAYVYEGGDRTDLPALEPGSNSIAHQINDAGTIVGISDPFAKAVVWRREADGTYGAPVDLGHRNINRHPVVNSRGDIAFTAAAPNGPRPRPLLWRVQPDGSYADPLFLGRPDPGNYFVRGINDAGLIVGYRWTGMFEMAVLWHPEDYSTPIDLGVGEAWGINAHNHIVGITGGEFPTFGSLPRRPALWVVESAGSVAGPFDIGTPAGFESAGARSISDSGWIVGSAWGPGEVMATVWRPEP